MKGDTMKTFEAGKFVLTSRVNDLISADKVFSKFVLESIRRHLKGDWGEMDPGGIKANERALEDGSRLFSAYTTGPAKIWIITESDRSATTVSFPDEYMAARSDNL